MALEKIKELELIKEKIQSEYASKKTPKYDEIHTLDNELATQLAEINSQIEAIKILEKIKADIKLKVESGTFTAEDYNALSEEHKLIAKDAIFEYYSTLVNTFHSLTAIEYSIVAMTKLFAKAIDTSKLSVSEREFLEAYLDIINLHPLGVSDASTWELGHINRMMGESVQRRNEYLGAKMSITGSI